MKRKKKKGNNTAYKNVSTGRNIFVCTFQFTKKTKKSTLIEQGYGKVCSK